MPAHVATARLCPPRPDVPVGLAGREVVLGVCSERSPAKLLIEHPVATTQVSFHTCEPSTRVGLGHERGRCVLSLSGWADEGSVVLAGRKLADVSEAALAGHQATTRPPCQRTSIGSTVASAMKS